MGRARQVGRFSVPGRLDRAAAEDAVERVGIAHLATRAYPTLSGGEQQLVLDRPRPASGARCWRSMSLRPPWTCTTSPACCPCCGTWSATAWPCLLTTHHPDHALFLADDVVLMHAPDDVRTGPAARMLSDEQLSALYAVPVHSVVYAEGGEQRRGLVTGYACTPPAPRLSPEPLPARTAPRRR